MLKFKEFIKESLVTENQVPQYDFDGKGNMVSKEEDVEKWVKQNERKIVNLSTTDINKIERRLNSAKGVEVRPGYSSKFAVYKDELYVIVSYGAPGVNRKIELEHVKTGKTINTELNKVNITPSIGYTLGVSSIDVAGNPLVSTVGLETKVIHVKRGIDWEIVEHYAETKATDVINLQTVQNLYKPGLVK